MLSTFLKDLFPRCYFVMIAGARLIKAARLLLGWSQMELAEKAKIGRTTISRLEAGQLDVRVKTLRAVQRALEGGGIRFFEATDIEGEGLRLRSPRPEV